MTAANAMQSSHAPSDPPQASAAVDRTGDDVGAFLAVVATIIRETVVRFEETVGNITESILTRSGAVEPDLIVTLQDFDRLQQEFTALSDVVAHVAATAGGPSSDGGWGEHHGRQAVGGIPISELRNRFLHHLGEPLARSAEAAESDEVLF